MICDEYKSGRHPIPQGTGCLPGNQGGQGGKKYANGYTEGAYGAGGHAATDRNRKENGNHAKQRKIGNVNYLSEAQVHVNLPADPVPIPLSRSIMYQNNVSLQFVSYVKILMHCRSPANPGAVREICS